MISAYLPAGTKIVCVSYDAYECRKRLRVGRVYTLAKYVTTEANDIGCLIAEIPDQYRPFPGIRGLWKKTPAQYCYRLEMFKLAEEPRAQAELPAVLLECLNARPVDKREVVEG